MSIHRGFSVRQQRFALDEPEHSGSVPKNRFVINETDFLRILDSLTKWLHFCMNRNIRFVPIYQNLKMFYIYILKSIAGRYYIGSTNNIDKRLKEHNLGKTRSTKNFRPWHIVYSEQFSNIAEARKRENKIKSWKSRKAIENLVEHF